MIFSILSIPVLDVLYLKKKYLITQETLLDILFHGQGTTVCHPSFCSGKQNFVSKYNLTLDRELFTFHSPSYISKFIEEIISLIDIIQVNKVQNPEAKFK